MKETLKDLRLQSKKTCAEVAQALGIANSSYYSYEQGVRRINIEQVLVLAELFDVSEKEVIQAQINSCQSCR
jgi:transcriptional regulator with XRE-family HTH domain